MPIVPTPRDYPLSMRLPREDVALIDRAAALRGRSRTDFIRESALRAAEDAILENSPIRLSEDGFAAFTAAIATPPTPSPEMTTILRRPPPWRTK